MHISSCPDGARCGGCPSGETNGIPNCHSQSHIADLIESLSAQLDQVTRERDAAVRDFTEFANSTAICAFCKDFEFDKPCDKGSSGEDCWQWRGVEVEG